MTKTCSAWGRSGALLLTFYFAGCAERAPTEELVSCQAHVLHMEKLHEEQARYLGGCFSQEHEREKEREELRECTRQMRACILQIEGRNKEK